MKNIKFLEPYFRVMDAVTSTEWVTTMAQLLRLDGTKLYNHSIHVALTTAHLALFGNRHILAEYGIPISSLILGAFLHDIGYVGTSGSTICGKHRVEMSPVEQIAFRMHIDAGIHQVRLHTDDPVVLDIVSMHHEYLDGSGFPMGRKGEELPPHVRMVSIANSLSSYLENVEDMSSDRLSLIFDNLHKFIIDDVNRKKYDIKLIQSFFEAISVYYSNLIPLHESLRACNEAGKATGE